MFSLIDYSHDRLDARNQIFITDRRKSYIITVLGEKIHEYPISAPYNRYTDKGMIGYSSGRLNKIVFKDMIEKTLYYYYEPKYIDILFNGDLILSRWDAITVCNDEYDITRKIEGLHSIFPIDRGFITTDKKRVLIWRDILKPPRVLLSMDFTNKVFIIDRRIVEIGNDMIIIHRKSHTTRRIRVSNIDPTLDSIGFMNGRLMIGNDREGDEELRIIDRTGYTSISSESKIVSLPSKRIIVGFLRSIFLLYPREEIPFLFGKNNRQIYHDPKMEDIVNIVPIIKVKHELLYVRAMIKSLYDMDNVISNMIYLYIPML